MHILISFSNLALLLLLQVTYSTCTGLRLVTSPGHTVVKRQETVQGWALVEDNCPDGLGVCGKRSCCPYGSYCDDEENTNSNLCCPTSEGCAYDVSKNSRCAVSTWVEFLTIKDPICCMPGEIGVQPLESEYYGHCVPAGTYEPPDMLASQAGASSTLATLSSMPTTAATSPVTTIPMTGTSATFPETTPTVASTAQETTPSTATTSSSDGAILLPHYHVHILEQFLLAGLLLFFWV